MLGLDKQKGMELVIGIAGVYSLYSLTGILQQSVIKSSYLNDATGQYQIFDLPYVQVIFVGLFGYVLGTGYNIYMYSWAEANVIPWRHSIKCGTAVVASTIAYSYAIFFTNFPVVMMVRSCNLLSVALVAVLFTGVNDTALKLGYRKIVVALIVTIGMIIFKVYDPNKSSDQHQTQLIGVVLMIISLVADGFLPDFQAVVKQRFKPHPIVLLAEVNKWTMILTIGFTIITGNFLPMFWFIYSHKALLIDMLIIGVLCFFGQVFIYRLVRQFKQHIVPFVITTRKIFTVGLSFAYFGHKYSNGQLVGIFVVLGASFYQFLSQIQKELGNKHNLKNQTSKGSIGQKVQ